MRRLLYLLLLPLFAVTQLPAADMAGILRADLDRIFSDPRFADAQWGVEVASLERSEVLYEKNPKKLYIPASNNKILTAAAALIRLGPEYRFKTQVLINGEISNGVLKGDLIVVGSGDPSSSSRIQPKDPFLAFRGWAASLKNQGIHAIAGNLLGDGTSFKETAYGHGWEWNDLVEGFAAPVSALQFNENLVEIEITPSQELNAFASIKMDPLPDYLTVDGRVITKASGSQVHVDIERNSSKEEVQVYGSLPLKSAAIYRTIAVQYPVRYYLSALKRVLSEEGIDTSSCEIKEIRTDRPQSSSLLWIHSSPPLSELMIPFLKMSLNLIGETLVKTLGMELLGEGAFSKGKEAVVNTLSQIGIDKESYSYADGSGLSRLNLVSADTLTRILACMYRQPCFPFFYNALSVAGVDGTLAERMKGTRSENNVRAKTGSLANVSAISGYVKTMDGEMLAFSIITNNFLGSKNAAEYIQDRALKRLSDFSRKGQKQPKSSKGHAKQQTSVQQ